MPTLQERLVFIADEKANLIAQLRELERLREQVRKAELWELHRQTIASGGSNVSLLRPRFEDHLLI
jgi:hypothetical protein